MEEMPPGFRFFPTEEELISFYLHNKLQQRETSYIDRVIPLVHVYSFEPWQLPKQCGELCHGDPEQWFFFVPRQEREVRGGKPSRTTESGYWKATGSPSYVHSCNGKVIGVKKSMVFYQGKAPTGRKTKWKMNEYRAIKEDKLTSVPELQHEVTLCRVYVVSGSLRAFDRRPTAVEMSISTCSNYITTTTIHTQENDSKLVAGIIPNTNQNATLKALKEESCSSESNSFSEGIGNQSIELQYAPVENEEASVFNFLENLMEWENTI